MNAQMIIDNCGNFKFNPKQFRKEMNITWMINDVKKQMNQEGGVNETGKMSEMSQKETIDKTFEDRQSQTTL